MILVPAAAVKSLKSVAGNNMYQRPYTKEEIRKHYPDKAEQLLKDPVHLWRAETGIELIHKEPTQSEQIRIWKNWNQMPTEWRKKSDAQSFKLFGRDNATHNKEIMEAWENLKGK